MFPNFQDQDENRESSDFYKINRSKLILLATGKLFLSAPIHNKFYTKKSCGTIFEMFFIHYKT